MSHELIFANAQLILKDEVITGSVHVRNGQIFSIDSGTTVPKGAIDIEGDFIAPGLVELHTDNLERHLAPRPNIHWPHRAAILGHDRELAATGITTVFDAIRVGSILSQSNKRYGKYAREIADQIEALRKADALKISHHLHLRAEICSETLINELAEFGVNDRVGIVSMMDHTPGQRQFRDLQKFEDYVCGKHGFDRNEFGDYVTFLHGLQSRVGAKHEAATVAAASHLGATLASHDDTTVDQVTASKAHGVTLAEFPTTLEAANACHAQGISTVLGAPNIVRGSSHSGNVAAMELAQENRLDILSSDYVPSGLLHAAMILGRTWGNTSRAIKTVTAAPAQAVGLHDRGQIEIGRRADLIRFSDFAGDVVLKATWVQGQRV